MEDVKTHKLLIYNDDKHDFLYIIACLIRFCKHDPLQAEQCALIAHNKGECSIKSGTFDDMFSIKNDLADMSITTEIEEYESHLY